MFYSQFILAKKGPLGTIWIAAHLERKLRKNQVADTDIGISVDSILDTEVPIALRLSSHLLLGVVRIYSRKVNYLFDDCSEALLKVKQAFRSTAVDLPPEQSKAPYHSITLPETFDLDDFELPDNEIFQGNDRHVSTREQITLQDTMDGVAFPTSQFGLDERFGDGDASQIGLDLDEDLFLEKGDAAGTSDILNNTDVYQSSTKEATSFKDDEHIERVSDPSASSTNYFSIQAPSTPGLMEEPNLPSAEEALINDDDHMDEDQNIPELAAKEVPGTAFSQVESSGVQSLEFNSNGNCNQLDEQENEHVKSERSLLPNEAVEATSPGNALPLKSTEHIEEISDVDGLRNKLYHGPLQNEGIVAANSQSIGGHFEHDEQENEQVMSERSILPNGADEATSPGNAKPLKSIEHIEEISGVDSLGNKLDHSPLQNEGIVAADSQSIRGHCDESGFNRAGDVIFAEVHDRDTCVDDGGKADLYGSYLPDSDIRSENKNSLAAQEIVNFEEIETIMVNNDYQCQKSDQPCQILNNSETSDCIGSEKLSFFDTPVLKPCNSHSHNICGVENLPDAYRLSAEDNGCSLGLSSKQDATNVAEISTDVHDFTMPTLKADQIAHEGADAIISNLDRPMNNRCLGEDYLEKENDSKVSDLSAPEKLLSVPDMPASQPDNVLVESTPGIEALAGDGNRIEVVAGDGENLFSGKKRSYTESTLTIQSLNSAASSGVAQSKQSVELVPEDDDLLSSILGGRSTAFKLKPSPAVTDSLPAKRQRTSTRSSAQKRKVLMDDSMVLHGDMIREQLTNTEDIRRVRKKAPCTRLEVWVLQKQFLEDGVFSELLFTGLLPEFRCLHSQPRDLSGIRIVQDDGGKVTNETDTSSRSMHAEGVETETPMSSGAGDKGRQEHEDSLEKTPSGYDSKFVVDALQKELETFDNEVAKQMSKHDVPVKKAEMRNEDQAGGEGNQPLASTAELASSVSLVPEVACNLTDNTKVDAPYLNETTGVVVSADIDETHQSIHQDYHMEFTREDTSTIEEVLGSGRQYQEGVNVNIDGISDGENLFEEREGVISADTVVVTEDVQGTYSSPVLNIPVTNSVDLEGSASLTSDMIMEECQLGEPRFENEEEVVASDTRHDDSCPMSNCVLEEDVKLDPSHIVETDLSSQDLKLDEKEDIQCLEMNHMLATDPIAIPTEFINHADHSDFGTDIIEHDTDFLNVDDDDVAEDYEDDTPNTEEKRLLDNSGWSSRTRAVANYLQVLFEKETHQAEKVIPLESLLAGKSRKEACRMFFETLVLKTKDYIDAEQEGSFCDIKIKPTGKLMKSEF